MQMKSVSKTATGPVYKNALSLICATKMRFSAVRTISPLVYGQTVSETMSVSQKDVNAQ